MKREAVGWLGFAGTLTGVGIQAFFPAALRFSFPIFILTAAIWATYAYTNRDRPLFFKNIALIVIDTIAVIRWFH